MWHVCRVRVGSINWSLITRAFAPIVLNTRIEDLYESGDYYLAFGQPTSAKSAERKTQVDENGLL
jgi:hypothetical protein